MKKKLALSVVGLAFVVGGFVLFQASPKQSTQDSSFVS